MSAPTEPTWIGDALVVACAKCSHKAAGATHSEGSGICPACAGAAFIVLATRNGARATDHRVYRPAFSSETAVSREQPQTDVTFIEDDRAAEVDDAPVPWQGQPLRGPTAPRDPGKPGTLP